MCTGKDICENFANYESKKVGILGITIDRKLLFHQDIKRIYKKTDQKLSVLLKNKRRKLFTI